MAFPTPTPARCAAWLLAALALLLLAGCLHYRDIAPGEPPLAYLPGGPDPGQAQDQAQHLSARYAPAFLSHNPGQAHKRQGSPVAALDAQGWPVISVDPAPGRPSITRSSASPPAGASTPT